MKLVLWPPYLTSTRFLPFNQGSNGAGNVGDGGNPENPDGYPTAYLWERVLRRENLLALLQHYVSLQTTETLALENGRQEIFVDVTKLQLSTINALVEFMKGALEKQGQKYPE